MMFILFSDFGTAGPYVGQLHAVLASRVPGIQRIDLMHDAPKQNPKASAYLLAALAPWLPPECICVAVVDPGVGSDREAWMLKIDARWFVGPHNGLFEILARRSTVVHAHSITWRPAHLSASFHGRDLFAPAAAMLARGETPCGDPWPDDWKVAPDRPGADWPDDLAEVIYVDGFGNLVTGLRTSALSPDTQIEFGGRRLKSARTFSDVAAGELFWYENSVGLVEIAANCQSAEILLRAGIGDAVDVIG